MVELSQKGMVSFVKEVFSEIKDPRNGKNIQFPFVTLPLSAFSVFFMQCPSFLYYQIALQKNVGRNNAKSLFGITHIPTDDQIRGVLDRVSDLQKIYEYFFTLLDAFEQNGYLTQFRQKDLGNTLLVAFDGTDHFASGAIHCPSCKIHSHADGTRTYSHSMVNPAIVSPHIKGTVIPLAPEFIVNTDGEKKQDCEINASKRYIKKYGDILAAKNVTIVADDLYAHEPFLKLLIFKHLHFIVTCKQESHVFLYDWLSGIIEGEQEFNIHVMKRRVFNGRTHEIQTVRYINQIPIKDGEKALLVNLCALTVTDGQTKKQTYANAWITDYTINAENVYFLCFSARARWRTENENNSALKNHGYYLEHNFGHGKHLASFLTTLILLSFLMHTILSFTDHHYQAVKLKLRSKQVFFRDMTAFTKYFPFADWDQLVFVMEKGLSNRLDIQKMLVMLELIPKETSPPSEGRKTEEENY